MLVSEGGKAMQSGENVLSAIRHDGTGNYAVNLARQGWDALGKGMHNVGHSLRTAAGYGIASFPVGRMRNRPRMPLILTQTTR